MYAVMSKHWFYSFSYSYTQLLPEKSCIYVCKILPVLKWTVYLLISDPQPTEEAANEDDELVEALIEEARHTAYVRGRWVYNENSQEVQYSVVHPEVCLPANGDYSSYSTLGKIPPSLSLLLPLPVPPSPKVMGELHCWFEG